MGLKSWDANDLPREKFLAKGPEALSDAELLAIIIRTGTKDLNAIELAKEVLKIANNQLSLFGRIDIEEFKQVKGIGDTKAITIAAALELGRRRKLSADFSPKQITDSKVAYQILSPYIEDQNEEALAVLFLNTANKVIRHQVLSKGGMTGTIVDIRVILRYCLLYKANKIIIAHNHPSGNLQPSKADIDITRKLKSAAELLDIELLDHIIVGINNYASLADLDLI